MKGKVRNAAKAKRFQEVSQASCKLGV